MCAKFNKIIFDIKSYDLIYDFQIKIYEHLIKYPDESFLIFCQHKCVITIGKNTYLKKNLLVTEEFLINQGIDIIQTDRGGDITAHMPGQLMIYPILNIKNHKLNPRKYINTLQNLIINLLLKYNIKSHKDENYPGIFVDKKKICSIGIRIKNHISYHGLALNINNDLSIFDYIIPCGIEKKIMTNMSNILHKKLDIYKIIDVLYDMFLDKGIYE